jgi:uncharacterized protein (TIGR02147 family)
VTAQELYAASDYRSYLQAYYAGKKSQGTRFSLRSWAKVCGFAAPDYLLRVMRGDRNLSDQGIQSLSKSMRLTEKQAEYFAALVQFNQAKTPRDKAERWQRVLALRPPGEVHRLRQEQFEVLRGWQHLALRSLLPVIAFDGDWARLGRSLDPPLTAAQARESVGALERLGLLKKNGWRYVAEQGQLSTGDEVASVALTEFHKTTSDLAKRSLDVHAPSQRDVSGITVSLSGAGVQRIKAKIREFRKQLLALAAQDQGEDRVYHLNLHFFPLTREGGWDA